MVDVAPKEITDGITGAEANGVLAYSVAGLSAATSIGKTSIYEEAKAGRLKLTHRCGRTIILVDDAKSWLRGEPAQIGGAA